MDPQQELFSELIERIRAAGYDVYDGTLPPEGTAYPFVYMGDCQQTDRNTKSAVIGNVYLTIHVWSNDPRQRGTLSGMMFEIKKICRALEITPSYSWDVMDCQSQIIPDDTTKIPLMHGIINITFRYT